MKEDVICSVLSHMVTWSNYAITNTSITEVSSSNHQIPAIAVVEMLMHTLQVRTDKLILEDQQKEVSGFRCSWLS